MPHDRNATTVKECAKCQRMINFYKWDWRMAWTIHTVQTSVRQLQESEAKEV